MISKHKVLPFHPSLSYYIWPSMKFIYLKKTLHEKAVNELGGLKLEQHREARFHDIIIDCKLECNVNTLFTKRKTTTTLSIREYYSLYGMAAPKINTA